MEWLDPPTGGIYVVLAHGAGGNMHTPRLRLLADALHSRGIGSVRFNFPYVEAKRKAPDPQARLEARYRDVAAEVRARAEKVFLGGTSMGGRIATHIVAAGELADGLVLQSYPLHPPGKPERIRDAHLYGIQVPMLFFHGTRDTFARRDLFDQTIGKVPTAAVHRIEGGDHGLKVAGRTPADVADEISKVIAEWVVSPGTSK